MAWTNAYSFEQSFCSLTRSSAISTSQLTLIISKGRILALVEFGAGRFVCALLYQ